MGLDQEKLRLRKIDLRKTHIQVGLEQVLRHRADLISDELAIFNRFLRHLEHRLGLQYREVGSVNLQQDVGTRRNNGFLLSLGVQVRTLHKLMGAPKVSDELADRNSVRVPVIDDRVVQYSCGDSAIILGFGSGQAAVRQWIIVRSDFTNLLLRCRSQILSGLNLRMILNGDLLRVLQTETLDGLSSTRPCSEGGDGEKDEPSILLSHLASSTPMAAVRLETTPIN